MSDVGKLRERQTDRPPASALKSEADNIDRQADGIDLLADRQKKIARELRTAALRLRCEARRQAGCELLAGVGFAERTAIVEWLAERDMPVTDVGVRQAMLDLALVAGCVRGCGYVC